jgi:hypothetical protein
LTPLGDFNERTSDDDDLILVNERSERDDTGEYIENEICTYALSFFLDLIYIQNVYILFRNHPFTTGTNISGVPNASNNHK